MSAIGTVSSFFVKSKKEVFNMMGLGADWTLALTDAGRETAQKVSNFASDAGDIFAWNSLISDVHNFVAVITSRARDEIVLLFQCIVKVGGSVCDVLMTLQTHVKVADWGKMFFWLKSCSYAATIVEETINLSMASQWLYLQEANLGARFFYLAKIISSIAFTALALYALVSEAALSPYYSLGAYTVLQISKICFYFSLNYYQPYRRDSV